MKKLLLLTILLFTITISNAQEINYGVRGALNISSLDFDTEIDFENDNRIGFAFSGFVEFQISEKFSIATELQWSAEGGKAEELRADYIQIPVLAKARLFDNAKFIIGPQYGIKTWEDRDGFNTTILSGVLGLEYMITEDLFLDVRYVYGFSNVLDNQDTVLSDLEANNRVLQIGFGIKI